MRHTMHWPMLVLVLAAGVAFAEGDCGGRPNPDPSGGQTNPDPSGGAAGQPPQPDPGLGQTGPAPDPAQGPSTGAVEAGGIWIGSSLAGDEVLRISTWCPAPWGEYEELRGEKPNLHPDTGPRDDGSGLLLDPGIDGDAMTTAVTSGSCFAPQAGPPAAAGDGGAVVSGAAAPAEETEAHRLVQEVLDSWNAYHLEWRDQWTRAVGLGNDAASLADFYDRCAEHYDGDDEEQKKKDRDKAEEERHLAAEWNRVASDLLQQNAGR